MPASNVAIMNLINASTELTKKWHNMTMWQTNRFSAAGRLALLRTCVATFGISASLCSSIAWAQDYPIFDPTVSALYKIIEGTKNEAVAVGPQYVQRWASNDEDYEKWLLVPAGDNLYHIRSKSAAQGNYRYMAVDPQGNVRLWGIGEVFDEGQKFGLVHLGHGIYNIRVGVDGVPNKECIATGSTGILVRWNCDESESQKFHFEDTTNWPKPVPQQGNAQPGQIPPPPEIESQRDLPLETTPPVLIGEAIIPSVYVKSDQVPDKLQQFALSPYYVLRREQYWTRTQPYGYYLSDSGWVGSSKVVEVTTGLTEDQSKSMEDTLGIVVSANAGFSYEGASAGLSTQISKQLKVTKATRTQRMKQITTKTTVNRPTGASFALASWKLVDKYTLLRATGDSTPVKTWEVFGSDTVETSFPKRGSNPNEE